MKRKIFLLVVLLSMLMLLGCKKEKTDNYIDVDKITLYTQTYSELVIYKDGTFGDLEVGTNVKRDYYYYPTLRIIKQKNEYTKDSKQYTYYRYFQVSESLIVLYQ